MKKFRKTFAAIVSLVCLTLTIAFFAACGQGDGDDETTVTYTVKVVLPDGTTSAGAGVQVAFCNSVTNVCSAPVATDANGVATYVGEKGVNYHVQINSLPAALKQDYSFTGYTPEDSTCYTVNWGGTSYTIVLTAKPE